jgi:type IV pilus assembly protein PilF
MNRMMKQRCGFGMRLALLLSLAAFSQGCAGSVNQAELEDQQRHAAAQRDLGIDHLTAGRTAMAIRKLQQAQQLAPGDPVTYLWLGEAYRRKGLLGKAEENLLQSLALNDPANGYNNHETILNLSALYIQLKRYEEAVAQCALLVDDPMFSTPWRALTNMGWAQYRMRDFVAARASYERALEFHPEYRPAHLNLGILDQKERRLVQAVAHFEAALEGERLSYAAASEANYRLAEIYVGLGKRRQAIDHFSVALEQSPHGRWGTKSKSYLELLR